MKKSIEELERLSKRAGCDSIFEYQKCMMCDYMNNDIPINKKRTKCVIADNTAFACDVYLLTEKVRGRIAFEKGERGPIFFRSGIYTFSIDD